ncbi:MAG: tetratricopeptide repeat protein [Candidatus Binatia bacterium]
MDASAWVIDVGDADFEREVLDRSATTPVVVDFWAPWCGPCRTLGPLLERLAAESAGDFVLAKVNVDEAPGLASVFGVQSIPAVKGFRDGVLVAEFVGAQPEAVVRELLARVKPTEADRLVREAASLPVAEADAKLRAALASDARHPRALVALARVLGDRGDVGGALELLERVSGQGKIVQEADRLAAALRMRGDGAGDEGALQARLASDPNDLAARIELGRALGARGRHEEALTELLTAVQRDPAHDDAAARKAMVDLFAVLGNDHPLTDRFRSELAKALYR